MGNDLTFPDIAKKCANVSAKFTFAKIAIFHEIALVKIFWAGEGEYPFGEVAGEEGVWRKTRL